MILIRRGPNREVRTIVRIGSPTTRREVRAVYRMLRRAGRDRFDARYYVATLVVADPKIERVAR